MARVRNKRTGGIHSVPAGHFSLVSDEYEVLVEVKPTPPEPPKAAPKRKTTRRKTKA